MLSTRTGVFWLVVLCLFGSTSALAWVLAGGPSGWLSLIGFGLTTLPALPLGTALFGRHHGAGWVAGAMLGYALTCLVLWIAVQVRLPWPMTAILWVAVSSTSLLTRRLPVPLVQLPSWSRRDTSMLLLVLLVVPLLLWRPFSRIGLADDQGNRRYRAYFTADFLWHVALTAELTRAQSPPRNPYLGRRPLHYYWTYFVVPATFARARLLNSLQAHLTINALGAGLLFVATVFIAAWCAVPRAGPVAIATVLTVVAASAEGAYALWDLFRRGRPLEQVKDLNIDAITAWFFQTQTIDSLPRSLWYTPQHAMACGLGLIALIVANAREVQSRAWASLAAGFSLGLALIVSPFLGGVFALMFGVTSIWTAAVVHGGNLAGIVREVSKAALAAVPVLLALAWCVASGTFEGAGGTVAIGLSRAAAAPLVLPLLSVGPVLVPGLAGLVIGLRRQGMQAAVVGLCTGFFLLYFVTLTLEPIWVGWRAGQVILVSLPALVAVAIDRLQQTRRWPGLAVAAIILAIGLPTTAIDWWNAQDVWNERMAAGFRWTVVVPPDTQAAVDWIRTNTPVDAVVQMSINPRGRETWTLIPTFAERRMAAGQPISLLRMPEYDERSVQADAMYKAMDAAEANRIARQLRVDYVYVDRVERAAFGDAAIAKFEDRRYFTETFRNGSAAVYAVR